MPASIPSNVKRHDDKIHGWSVIIRREGRTYTKSFADKKNGGKENALQAAYKYRQKLLRQLPAKARYLALSVRNTSGVVGVGLTRERSKAGTWHLHYKARWSSPEGGVIQRKFSIERYWADEAFRFAVQARQEGLKQLKTQKAKPLRPPAGRKEHRR